ncbi:IS66 family transposase zinc-finger binding domain-containing protein [Acetobacterium tundrae]|uniref:IS66 family transposase zinc-finger binding domain-containing protein n=1 Tax=Acetobacterium tundrae TaxID=132932 RepID=UPI00242CFA24|nr:IS66 family transposase zinc-finger binding domain-containing protein [Acetobacterium tundrae]
MLKFIPARFEVEEHRRHVYTCRECAKHDDGIDIKIPFIRAAMPNTLIPGSFTTPELVAAIINAKYVCAMPLARQQQEFERYNVAISRQDDVQLVTALRRRLLFASLSADAGNHAHSRYFTWG